MMGWKKWYFEKAEKKNGSFTIVSVYLTLSPE